MSNAKMNKYCVSMVHQKDTGKSLESVLTATIILAISPAEALGIAVSKVTKSVQNGTGENVGALVMHVVLEVTNE